MKEAPPPPISPPSFQFSISPARTTLISSLFTTIDRLYCLPGSMETSVSCCVSVLPPAVTFTTGFTVWAGTMR